MPPGGYYSQPQPAAQQLPPDNGVVYDPVTDSFIQQTAPDPTQAPPPPMDPGLLQTAGGYGGMPAAPPPPSGPTMGPMGQYSAGPIQGTDLPAPVDPYAGGYGQGGYLQSAGGYGGMPTVDPGYGLDKTIAPPPQYDPALSYGSAPVIHPIGPGAPIPAETAPPSISFQQNPGLAPGQSIYPPEPDATGYRTPGGDPSVFPAGSAIPAEQIVPPTYIPLYHTGDQTAAPTINAVDPATADLNQRLANIQAARASRSVFPAGSAIPAEQIVPPTYIPLYHTGDQTAYPVSPKDWIQSVDRAVPPLQWLDDRLHQIQSATDQVAHGGNGGIVNRNGTLLSTQQANQPIFPQLVPNMDRAVPLLQTVDDRLGTGPGGSFGSDPNAIASLLGPSTPSGATPTRPALPRSSFRVGAAIPAETDTNQTRVSAQVKMPDGSTQAVQVKNADGTTSDASILVDAKTGAPVVDGAGKKIIYAVKNADGSVQSYADWLARNGGGSTDAATTNASGDTVVGGDGSGTVVQGGDSGSGSGGGSSSSGDTKKSYGGYTSHSSGSGYSKSSGGGSSSYHKSTGSYSGGGSYSSNRDGIYHVTKSDGSRVTVDLNNLPDEVKNNDAFMALLKKDPSSAAKLLAEHGYGTTRGAGRGARARRKGLGANGLPVASTSTSTTSTNGRAGPLASQIFDRYFEIANKPIPPDVAKAVVESLPVESAGGAKAGRGSASTGNAPKKKK